MDPRHTRPNNYQLESSVMQLDVSVQDTGSQTLGGGRTRDLAEEIKRAIENNYTDTGKES